jgi:hypothetical protein
MTTPAGHNQLCPRSVCQAKPHSLPVLDVTPAFTAKNLPGKRLGARNWLSGGSPYPFVVMRGMARASTRVVYLLLVGGLVATLYAKQNLNSTGLAS